MLTLSQRLSLAWRILRKDESNSLRHANSELLRAFPPWVKPEIAEQIGQELPLTLLTDALPEGVLIEQGTGWVKVHGLGDAEPLFKLLTAAKIANERA